MLPMGIALAKTEAATLLAGGIVSLLGNFGSLALLAGICVVTIVLTQAMNGAAVAAIIGPVAIRLSEQTGANPRSFMMAVALCASMAFVTPLGHAVNVLVMGPGGYNFRDYMKIGLPMTVFLFLSLLLILPMVWRL
jgi:di/tricarboxylate transporter